ncbi:MAG: hypothetical protein E7J04_09040 [Clostridioides difficile]|nr:hypothetical protein [Clostridioides difficile]
MRESLLNEYNLKTDEDVEYFVKFANEVFLENKKREKISKII